MKSSEIRKEKEMMAFELIYATLELSGLYMRANPHKMATVYYTSELQSITFKFGEWKGFDFEDDAKFFFYLDTDSKGNSYDYIMDYINAEKERALKKVKQIPAEIPVYEMDAVPELIKTHRGGQENAVH